MKKLLLLLFVPVVLNAGNWSGSFIKGDTLYKIKETDGEAVITTITIDKWRLKCDNNKCPKSTEDWKKYLFSSNIFENVDWDSYLDIYREERRGM